MLGIFGGIANWSPKWRGGAPSSGAVVILSLLGLMISVGLLVDNSVVVAENIHRLHREGLLRERDRVAGLDGDDRGRDLDPLLFPEVDVEHAGRAADHALELLGLVVLEVRREAEPVAQPDEPFRFVFDVTRFLAPGKNRVRFELLGADRVFVLRNVKIETGEPLAVPQAAKARPAPAGPRPVPRSGCAPSP